MASTGGGSGLRVNVITALWGPEEHHISGMRRLRRDARPEPRPGLVGCAAASLCFEPRPASTDPSAREAASEAAADELRVGGVARRGVAAVQEALLR